ncbi:MAG TPA: DoxX family protein [Planctomycetota bacterium]|nr:DoxX family protein [Planctomycetota bacterium]
MPNRLLPYAGYAYALLRIVAGLLFMLHGLAKFGLLGGKRVELMSQMGAGAVIETVAGALILLGLFASPAAFIASGTMLVAYVQFHWFGAIEKGAPLSFLPLREGNGGETAVLYCLIFLYIACAGSGPLSIDRLRKAEPRQPVVA